MYYTFDELRQLGCSDSLLMQYIFLTKEEIDKLCLQIVSKWDIIRK